MENRDGAGMTAACHLIEGYARLNTSVIISEIVSNRVALTAAGYGSTLAKLENSSTSGYPEYQKLIQSAYETSWTSEEARQGMAYMLGEGNKENLTSTTNETYRVFCEKQGARLSATTSANAPLVCREIFSNTLTNDGKLISEFSLTSELINATYSSQNEAKTWTIGDLIGRIATQRQENGDIIIEKQEASTNLQNNISNQQSIRFTASGEIIATVSGRGAIVDIDGAQIIVSDGTTAKITGDDNYISGQNDLRLTVIGASDEVNITGHNSELAIGGNGQYTTGANYNYATFTEAGGKISVLNGSSVDIHGNEIAVSIQSNSVVGVYGTGDIIQVSGANSNVWTGGNGQYVEGSKYNYIYFNEGISGQATIISNSSVDIYGDNISTNVQTNCVTGVYGNVLALRRKSPATMVRFE